MRAIGAVPRARALAAVAMLVSALAACADEPGRSAADPVDAADPASAAIAFVGATVLPMDSDRRLPAHTVVVVDGRIAVVAPDGDAGIPDGAQRIDARGKYLLPGLAEMHGHVPPDDDSGYADDVLFLYLSNGVTTVRNMAGDASHLALRDGIAAGRRLGPTLHAASPWLGEDARTPAQAEAKVREHHAAGFDLLKVGGLPKPGYEAMARTARDLGIPFAGHVPEDVGLAGALDAGQASIDHLDRYIEFLVPPARREGRPPGFFGNRIADLADPALIEDAVARTRAAGTWNVPTLTLVGHLSSAEPLEAMAARPEMRYMPRAVVDGWVAFARDYRGREGFTAERARAHVELNGRLVHALHAAGAPIALGSDAPQFFNVPGFSIHHEVAAMVEAGLSPYEVIATGTREAARYFGTPAEFGTVTAGARADLLLLEADPFADAGNLRRRAGVMVRGAWWPEARIQARLDEVAERMAAR